MLDAMVVLTTIEESENALLSEIKKNEDTYYGEYLKAYHEKRMKSLHERYALLLTSLMQDLCNETGFIITKAPTLEYQET